MSGHFRTGAAWVLGGALLAPAVANAQSDCERLRSCCLAMAAAGTGTAAQCGQFGSIPPAMCGQALSGMAMAASRMAPSVAAACGVATGGGGGSDTPPGPGSTPPTPDGPSSPPGGTGSGPSIPTGLPPDPGGPGRSTGGRMACVIDHDGHRVMVTGQSQRFSVRCSGIPLPGNPLGAGAPTTPPLQTGDGRTVGYHWSAAPSGGELSPLAASAVFTPATATPDARITVTVSLPARGSTAGESVTLVANVRVVPRTMRLQMDSTEVHRCIPRSTGFGEGSLAIAYTLTCSMSASFTVGDDLSVRGNGGSSCGAGQVTGVAPCVLMGQTIASGGEAVPGWSLTSVSGQIDSDTGIARLQLAGQRVGGIRVHFPHGRDIEPTMHPLFELPFPIEAIDGATQSFGSLNTRPEVGGVNAFSLHAH